MLLFPAESWSRRRPAARRRSSFLAGTGCRLLLSLLIVSDAAATEPEAPIAIRPLLEKHCFRCHGAERQKGEFRIDGYRLAGEVIRDRKAWLKVLEQLETREMPTKGTLPSKEEYEAMVSWVDGVVNGIDWEAIRHPGHVTIPRLTKQEYDRTMSDLLGIELSAGRELSDDGEGKSGFTNDREGLFITPSRMEKYFDAAERSIESLVALNGEPLSLHLESEAMFMTESGSRPQPFPDEAEGYILNRGQMTLYDSIDVPSDGLFRFTVRARSTTNGPTAGRLRLNDVESGDFDVPNGKPGDFEVIAFLPKGGHQMAWNIKLPESSGSRQRLKKPEAYAPLPGDAAQVITEESKKRSPKVPRIGTEQGVLLNLMNRYDAAQLGVQRAYEWLRLYGPDGDPRQLERFHGYVVERTKSVEAIRSRLLAELREAGEIFDHRFAEANRQGLEDRARLIEMAKSRVVVKPGSLAIDWIRVDGPLGRENLMARALADWFRDGAPEASDRKALETALIAFASRAFRRKVDSETVTPYLSIYDEARNVDGLEHSTALKRAMSALLVSPRFLFRLEQEQAPGIGEAAAEFPLDDWELASRLSYFLWVTMPDERLFSLAGAGRLTDRATLVAEVDRLLDDEKADAFLEIFAGQWLGYELLGRSVIPDAKRFPEFTPALARAMKAETRLWFGEVFRGNRSLLDLIEAEETYLDATLARHYGIAGVTSPTMERVTLTTPHRGGILGMGSVLTATSTPVRTSPVLRGVWVMERLLGEDAGEPLADAGELPGNAGETRGKTLREELAIHRDRAECAGCHDRIDPPGFGLEQFDAIGRFREREAGRPVDATGVMPDGTEFTGVTELKRYLVEERADDFTRNVAERMLAFALGRELKVYDEPAVQAIVEATVSKGYRARALVKAVVLSYPFLNQHPEPEIFAGAKLPSP